MQTDAVGAEAADALVLVRALGALHAAAAAALHALPPAADTLAVLRALVEAGAAGRVCATKGTQMTVAPGLAAARAVASEQPDDRVAVAAAALAQHSHDMFAAAAGAVALAVEASRCWPR